MNLSLIVIVFLLSNFLHRYAINQIRTISSIKKNLHYCVTGVATGIKISFLHFYQKVETNFQFPRKRQDWLSLFLHTSTFSRNNITPIASLANTSPLPHPCGINTSSHITVQNVSNVWYLEYSLSLIQSLRCEQSRILVPLMNVCNTDKWFNQVNRHIAKKETFLR